MRPLRNAGAEHIAAGIRADGDKAEAAALVALDPDAVAAYVEDLARRHDALDISFNTIGLQD